MRVANHCGAGPDGRSQARRCASRPFGPQDKNGILRTERSFRLLLPLPVSKFCLRKINPPTFWAWYKYCQPSQSRSFHLSLPFIHNFDSPSTFINLFHFQTPIHKNSHSNLRISRFSHPTSQKCLPKLLRRSPPPVARPQLARHLPTRRRLARRLPPLLQARRRSVARQGRRPTLATSTKVCFSLARRAELQTLETWSHFYP